VNHLDLVVDVGGWLGALLVVAAFALNAFNLMDVRGRIYQAFNILGSILLIINTGWHHAWPSAFVNVVWVLIAAAAAIKHARAPAPTVLAPPNPPDPRGGR
jgi:hypothetical protein